MALQYLLLTVAALLVCGVTARLQKPAVFEPINTNSSKWGDQPSPRTAEARINGSSSRVGCPSGPVYAPPCNDSFPLTTLEAGDVVAFVLPGPPLKVTPFSYCGWEFQGPTDSQLQITCETTSFFFGQYFLVWNNGSVTGVHHQQNVDILYQFASEKGRVAVRTLSKTFYQTVMCEVTVVAGTTATTQAATTTKAIRTTTLDWFAV